jgi:hypothetical protein
MIVEAEVVLHQGMLLKLASGIEDNDHRIVDEEAEEMGLVDEDLMPVSALNAESLVTSVLIVRCSDMIQLPSEPFSNNENPQSRLAVRSDHLSVRQLLVQVCQKTRNGGSSSRRTKCCCIFCHWDVSGS